MTNYKTARIIPIAVVLIITAIAIAGLVALTRIVFFSGNNGNVSPNDTSKEVLLSASSDRMVSLTVRGRIVANETFRSYQIQITPNQRTFTTFKGYLDQPIDNVSLTNNVPAYEQLVYALYRANLIKGTELTGDNNDLRGVCSNGLVYEFKVLKAGKLMKQLWTSSCPNARGSLNAKVGQLNNLFIDQIPSARSLIGKLWQ